MQTGIHQWLLNNPQGWILFDVFFYSMPLLYLFIYKYVSKLASAAAILMLLVNWFYVQCYTLYPSNSIEGHIAWLFFPIVFIPRIKKHLSFFLKVSVIFFFSFLYRQQYGNWRRAGFLVFHK